MASPEPESDLRQFCLQSRYPLNEQLRILALSQQSSPQKPFICGHLNPSHTEPEDYLEFVHRGAAVLLIDSGIILHNLAARNALNRMAVRPLLLWMVGTDRSQEYLLGEEWEAAATGSDGVVYKSSDLVLFPPAEISARIARCRLEDISVCVIVEDVMHLEWILDLEHRPQVLLTSNPDDEFKAAVSEAVAAAIAADNSLDLLHVSLYRLTEDTPSLGHIHSGCAVILEDISLLAKPPVAKSPESPLVKVCGVRSIEAADKALESGADMIGMILVPGRGRSVDAHDARRISDFVHSWRLRKPSFTGSAGLLSNKKREPPKELPAWPSLGVEPIGTSVFEVNAAVLRAKARRHPLVVGVFHNQPLETILASVHELNLDIVQLHGSEPLEWCRFIPVPVFKRFTPGAPGFDNCSVVGYHYLPLLDGEMGGEGRLVDWTAIKSQVSVGARFLLAGGLTEHNVSNALLTEGVVGVDVSGGVETNGIKDLGKIERFVRTAKADRQ